MTINHDSAGKPQALTSAEISKIVETEGAQAADSSNLDDLELVPGDLEVGDCESDAEVIENLHELDVAAEDCGVPLRSHKRKIQKSKSETAARYASRRGVYA